MIEKTGLTNCLGEERYPELAIEEMVLLKPDLIFLSSEPFPFKEDDAAELRNSLPLAKIVSVDGEMFSWYGSRLLLAAEYFTELSSKIQR